MGRERDARLRREALARAVDLCAGAPLKALVKGEPIDWDTVPWTPFERVPLPDHPLEDLDPTYAMFLNSRYQVAMYLQDTPPFGVIAHLSFKTHDKAARHDFRDMQRIKNEICGPEADAVEIYPAESKLVDSANQYHLYVFQSYRLPFGMQDRLVGDGNWENSVQRPFPPGERPADCMDSEGYQARVDALLKAHRKAQDG